MKDIADLLSALLTPLIACITVYIAYRQWRSEQAKLNHELYEKRFPVYAAVAKLIMDVMWDGKVKEESYKTFVQYRFFADIFFDPEVNEYMGEIDEKAQRLKLLPALAGQDEEDAKAHGKPFTDEKTIAERNKELGELQDETAGVLDWKVVEVTLGRYPDIDDLLFDRDGPVLRLLQDLDDVRASR